MQVRFSFLVSLFVILSGCVSTVGLMDSVQREAEIIFTDELTTRGASALTSEQIKTEPLRFDAAVLRAAARDEKVAVLKSSLREGHIDLRQAKSMLWPRFDLVFSVEFPLGTDSVEDDMLSEGGLFLRYDLLDVLFLDKSITAANLRISIVSSLHRAALTDVYYRILEACLELEVERLRLRIEEEALKISEEGTTYLTARMKNMMVPLEAVAQWRSEAIELAIVVSSRKQKIDLLFEVISYELGLSLNQPVSIVDIEQYLPSNIDINITDQNIDKIAAAAWSRRDDINSLKYDLALAELNILEARKKRYPRINLSLGIGSVRLRSRDENSLVVPSFGITLPLIDMGDASRDIEIATVKRDTARESMALAIRTLITEIHKARIAVISTRNNVNLAEQVLANCQHEKELIQHFPFSKDADPLDFFRGRIAVLKAESTYQSAKFEYQKALIRTAKLQGICPCEKIFGY